MIIKERETPLHLLKLEALVRRISQFHPKYEQVKEHYATHFAGFRGERSLDFPLSFLESNDIMIYHDLRIYDGEHYFQIDTLLLSPYYLLILEVKNISGTLMFDPAFNQLIRISDTSEEAFPDPLTQVKRQRSQLITFLKKCKLPEVAVETLVVVSNRSTVVKATDQIPAIASRVIRSDYLPTRIKAFRTKYQNPFLTQKDLRRLGKLLIKAHEQLNVDILRRYSLTAVDVVDGVFCPDCMALPIKRMHGRWKCLKCGVFSKDAHIKALNDYALLISKEITNQEARRFLGIDSISATSKMLVGLGLNHTGSKKGRKYFLEIEKNDLDNKNRF